MTTRKRLTDFIGLTEAQMDAAGTRVRAAEASGRDQFLHVRVDAELRARAVAAAATPGKWSPGSRQSCPEFGPRYRSDRPLTATNGARQFHHRVAPVLQ